MQDHLARTASAVVCRDVRERRRTIAETTGHVQIHEGLFLISIDCLSVDIKSKWMFPELHQ